MSENPNVHRYRTSVRNVPARILWKVIYELMDRKQCHLIEIDDNNYAFKFYKEDYWTFTRDRKIHRNWLRHK